MPDKRQRLIERAARIVAVVFGLIFAAGVVTKLMDWEATRDAMTAYRMISWLPPALPAAGSLTLEALVAVTLLYHRSWKNVGLPACGAFWAITGVMLAVETMLGGGGDCGCLPFMPRDISWMATAQNASAALFLISLWRLLALGEEDAVSAPASSLPAGN